MIVRMLATVSFSKSVDEHGVEVTPVVSMSTGLTRYVFPRNVLLKGTI